MAMAVVAAAVTAGLLMRRRNRKDKEDKVVIAIGTKNKCKVQAVAETVKLYPMLAGCTLHPYAVSSGIDEQPIGLEYTAQGARNRAKEAFEKGEKGENDLSLGIESGLFGMDNGRYYDVCVCAAYDGEEYHLGMSCAFEIPRKIVEFVVGEKGGEKGGCATYHKRATERDRGRRETGGGTRTHWDT